jgi:protein involved in polysaccharide export with SLBB domain
MKRNRVPLDRLRHAAVALFLAPPLALGAPAPGSTGSQPGLAANEAREFRLSPGDVIEFRFYHNPELNDTVQIRPDGRISLPLVGEIDLRNKSVAEVTRAIEGLFAAHLKTPSITIQVRSYASQKVYVGGEVLRPGVISLAGELSLLEAIMEAGGAQHTASSSSVILIRKGDRGAPTRQRIAMKGKDGAPTTEAGTLLRPFDIVLVPASGITKADRWVDKYIRQLIPFTLTGGFTYLIDGGVIIR